MSGPNALKPEHEFDVVVASGLMRAISLISEPSEESTDVIPDRRVIYENGLARRKVSRPLRFFDLRKNIAKGRVLSHRGLLRRVSSPRTKVMMPTPLNLVLTKRYILVVS